MRCGQGYDKEIKIWVTLLSALSIMNVVRIVSLNVVCMEYCRRNKNVASTIIAIIIVAISLLAAMVMDLKTCTVYNFLWWIIGAVGASRMFMQGVSMDKFVALLLFVLLQECFFYKMYGRADCHGFGACAAVGASFGMGLKQFLVHMLLAFGLLGIVQGVKGNVGQNGNLKRPVPFVPYLATAFWVNLGAYLCV